jgi:hypothetical protein
MANIDKEIEDARARVERLKEKKRVAEAKECARFTDAIMSVLYEIGSAKEVSVRTLVDRAQVRLDEQDAKRREASRKAAAKRRQAAQGMSEAHDSESHNEMNEATENQTVWG